MKSIVLALILLAAPAFALPTYGQATLTSASSTWCLPITGQEATAVIALSGTWTGTPQFLVGVGRLTGNVQQVPALATNFASQTEATSTMANGVFLMPVSGFSQVCVSPPTTGSMVVFVELNLAPLASAFSTLLVSTTGTTTATGAGSYATEVILPPNPNNVIPRCNAVRQSICR